MQTLKKIGIGIAVGAVLMFAYHWQQASVLDAELAVMKEKNAQQKAHLNTVIDQLDVQNDALRESNRALREARFLLKERERELRALETTLRAERDRRLLEIPDMPLNVVAKTTLDELDLPLSEVTVTGDGMLMFTPDASKVNLEHLILGAAAEKELGLKEKRIALLVQQNSNLQTELDQTNELLVNERGSHEAEVAKLNLDLEEKQKEIQVVKAKARKKNAIATVVGFVGGLLAKAILF